MAFVPAAGVGDRGTVTGPPRPGPPARTWNHGAVAHLRMHVSPGDMSAAEPVIATLRDRYEAWYRARHPADDVVDVSDLDLMLQWKVNYDDGRLDEWTVGHVEEFLLDWCPRKVTAPAALAAQMPGAVAQAFEFLGDQRMLSPRGAPAARLAAHARSLTGQFTAEMNNPANFGMAKSMFGGLDVDADEPITQERLDELVSQFNALPFEERKALTDPGFVEEEEPELPVIGPVRLPDDDAVRASADAAPVLAGFTSLADFFRAPGRPLTTKGNIKLADAQALSEVLGTESLEERIGEHTFRRRSSAEMPRLDHWQWWAREAGAIRTRGGRLVGVEAWLKRRAKDPVGEARKAFDVLTDYGPVSSSTLRGPWRVDRLVDQMTAPLLGMLLSAGEPVEFDRLVDALESARDMTGDQGFFPDQPEYRRSESASTMDRLLQILERAGVLVQHDVGYEPIRRIERRVGGTVELTPFGVVTSVDIVRESGPEVVTIGDPADLTAQDVADLVIAQAIDPPAWVELLAEWVGHRQDRQDRLDALQTVVEALADEGALLLTLALEMPESLEDDVAEVMHRITQTRGPEDVLGALALTWLANHDRLDGVDLPREAVLTSGAAALGLLAQDDPQAAAEAMGTDATGRQDHLELVMHASRVMPPNVEALLDAIGKHHPDKVVAKAARKELIRVRSRLAYRRQQAQQQP